MTALFWIKVIIAVATIGFGLLSVLRPRSAGAFTGLTAPGPRGISEIRSVIGGLFVGLGIAALIFRTHSAFGTVGIGYLTVGAVRAASIYHDRAPTRSNWISLGFEIVSGILLLV